MVRSLLRRVTRPYTYRGEAAMAETSRFKSHGPKRAIALALATAVLAAAFTVVPITSSVPVLGDTDEQASAQCPRIRWMCDDHPAKRTADLVENVVTWVWVQVWVVTCHPVTGGGLAGAGLAKSAAGAARVAANIGYTGATVAILCTGRWVWQQVRG